MAQDPEGEPGGRPSGDEDISHESGMVLLFESMAADAEVNADNIHGVLQSSGIESLVRRSSPYPNFGVAVLVAEADLERAKSLIAEALAAGPEAAADAEAQSETQ